MDKKGFAPIIIVAIIAILLILLYLSPLGSVLELKEPTFCNEDHYNPQCYCGVGEDKIEVSWLALGKMYYCVARDGFNRPECNGACELDSVITELGVAAYTPILNYDNGDYQLRIRLSNIDKASYPGYYIAGLDVDKTLNGELVDRYLLLFNTKDSDTFIKTVDNMFIFKTDSSKVTDSSVEWMVGYDCGEDCGVTEMICGDTFCVSGETSENCAKDCGCPNGLTYTPKTGDCNLDICGDSICTMNENGFNCAKDCGCKYDGGLGVIYGMYYDEATETCMNYMCGDNICEGESVISCPVDCAITMPTKICKYSHLYSLYELWDGTVEELSSAMEYACNHPTSSGVFPMGFNAYTSNLATVKFSCNSGVGGAYVSLFNQVTVDMTQGPGEREITGVDNDQYMIGSSTCWELQ